jgi:hypothetical protein
MARALEVAFEVVFAVLIERSPKAFAEDGNY